MDQPEEAILWYDNLTGGVHHHDNDSNTKGTGSRRCL